MFRSLKVRLVLAFLCAAGCVALMAIVGTSMNKRLVDAYQEAAQEQAPQLEALAGLTVCLARVMEDGLALAYLGGKEEHEIGTEIEEKEGEEVQEAIQDTLHWIERFSELARAAGEVDDILEAGKMKRSMLALVGVIEDLQEAIEEGGENYNWEAWHLKIEEARDEVLALIKKSISGELEEMQKGQGEVAEARAKAVKADFITASATLLLAGVLGFVTIRSVTRPLDELQEAAKQYGEGNLNHRVQTQKLIEFQRLADSVNTMADDVREAQCEREAMHKSLTETSRMAGMAEVATGVLHNVGNVLNNVNISVDRMSKRVKGSKVADLAAVSSILNEHTDDLGHFICNDKRGQRLPAFLTEMSRHMDQVIGDMGNDLEDLLQSVRHINQIVTVQQSYAKVKGFAESCDLSELVDDALEINAAGLDRHGIKVTKEYTSSRQIFTDRHKVLQILINLISNAKHALDDNDAGNKRIHIGIHDEDDSVIIEVRDNGSGIEQAVLPRIFEHGFTTRKAGHGFGLHNGALTAKELGGALKASSDGSGKGAVFQLRLPGVGNQEDNSTDVTTSELASL